LPAGSSGTALVQYDSVNVRTPDGTVLTPTATFSATNASGVQASAGAEIDAATHLAITKRRLATPEPPLNVDVTYEINIFDSSWPNFANPLPGTWSVVNAVVTDTLPSGAVFVSATGGGTYDAATNTVTWPAIPEVATYAGNCGLCYYITIRYPSPPFIADNNPANPSDAITNTVRVTGKPYGLPTAPDVTALGSVMHGFVDQPTPNGLFRKLGYGTGVRGVGEVDAFELQWDNPSSLPMNFTGFDRLPCQVTSPTGPLTPCANPGLRLTQLWLRSPVIYAPVVVSYTTNLGLTGTLVFTRNVMVKAPGLHDVVPRAFGPGEYVSHLTVSGVIAGGFSQTLVLRGIVAPDFPDDPATETDSMTNCAEGSFDFGAFGGAQGPLTRCHVLPVVPPKPWYYHFKGGTSLSAIAPTEARTFSLSAAPCGTLPWRPIITDLLPANLRYVPGTQNSNASGFPSLGGTPPTFEVIENFNGTGRQLLRWSWPGGQAMTECSYLVPTFQARVEPGTPTGTYTNYGQFFDAAFTDNNTPTTNTCVYAKEQDVEDYDGDGNTTEYRCISATNYTVVQTASMVVIKEVRGSYDASFRSPPAVGLVNPGDAGDYRITLQNTGNLSLTNFVAYDILPFVGDTGVSGTQLGVARGSQWQPTLAGAVTPPPGGTVEYSLSTNPCRGEVITQGGALASGPAGCVNDWTSSPASFSAVRAIRITLGSTVLGGGEGRTVIVPITAPMGVEGIAWNTVALAGQRADTSTWLLPTEPPKVGLAVPIDLELDKTVSPAASVFPGATLTYTVKVTNRGPGSASGVAVRDVLPAGLTFQSAAPAASYNSSTGVWTVGNLALNESATLTVTASVNAGTEGATLTNYAQVSAANEVDLDSTPNNNPGPTPAEDDEDAVSTMVIDPNADADLAITKSDLSDPVLAGDNLAYLLEVTNNGPADAQSVSVTDTLPTGVSFISAIPSQGSCAPSGNVVSCDLGSLANSARASITINVTVNDDPVHTAGCPVALVNYAVAVAPQRPDPDLSNNVVAARTTVFLDDFNRADGALGANWAGDASPHDYAIVNQQVDVENGGAIQWEPTLFGADQEACVTLTTVDPYGFHQSLLLKIQGSGWSAGAVAVYYHALDGEIGIETYRPDEGWTTLATFDAVLQDGDVLGARALADGTVQAFVNGLLIGEADAGSFFAGKGGRVGLWFIVAADTVLDDFSGGAIGALADPGLPPLVSLRLPSDALAVDPGTPTVLRAAAFDIEDGLLDESQFAWRSDRDGELGTGAELELARLSSGQHVITLTITDSDGQTATATANVFVKYRLLLPLVLRSP
jgi:uncharacterized repeat protein (TIGR01451 family)